MRSAVLLAWLALPLAAAAFSGPATQQVASQDSVQVAPQDASQEHHRAARWVVFRPMFVTKSRQRQFNRNQARRAWMARNHKRPKRALHFPAGSGAGEESGLALRVAVNDLLFQSAPANDLPSVREGGATAYGGAIGGAGSGALRPILLARLRAASREREPAEEEAFLLMSAAGGKPAIVPAPTSRPEVRPPNTASAAVPRPSKTKQAHNKHKRKGSKRRVARAAPSADLGQRLDAMASSLRERADLAQRVKKYDAQGMYPAYSYTHGRYTRATAATPPAVTTTTEDAVGKVRKAAAKPAGVKAPPAPPVPRAVKVKVKVEGDDDEEMDAAETIVFRPLFVQRERDALRQEQKRRRQGFAKKPTKPTKPLRRRQPRPQPPRPQAVRRPVPVNLQRRTYHQRPWYPHQYSPLRRVVYYH